MEAATTVRAVPTTATVRQWSPLLTFRLALLAAFLFRTWLIFGHGGFLGVDMGAYLAQAEGYLGKAVPQTDFVRPPLAPGWLLVPFVWLFGAQPGALLFTLVGSFAPLVPLFLLARKLAGEQIAVIACVFALIDPQAAQMTVTGVLPMLGFALLLTAILAAVSAVEDNRWELPLALSLGAIPWVNQTTAGITIVVMPVLLAGLCHLHGWRKVAKLSIGLAAGACIGLAALPWYLGVAPGSGEVRFPGPLVTWPLLGTYNLYLGALFIIIAVAGWYWLKGSVRIAALTLGWLGLLSLWFSYDEAVLNVFYRSTYLAAYFGWIVVAALLVKGVQVPWARAALIAVTIGLLAPVFASTFRLQAWYSDMMPPETVTAVNMIHSLDPQARIATNGRLSAIWIAALTQQPAIWTHATTPPKAFAQGDYEARCLAGFVPDCNPVQVARTTGTRWVLVDRRFQDEQEQPVYGAPEGMWDVTAEAPWLELVYRSGSVNLWRVKGA